MLLNKLLIGNLMIGFTVLLQGLIPLGYVSDQASFWMYIAAIMFLVLAVIAFGALLFMGRSRCILTMGQMKLAIYHSPTAGFSLFSLIFFISYAFVAEVSVGNAAIQNAILLLVTASGFLLFTSIIIVFLAFRTKYEIAAGESPDE
ncbi:unnamed protein product [Caenorhabditis sp. 36 PRJEB53466]|nr:unnamed protein product [Caenorhabditis sp. 36 PRJEB53466]